MTNVPLIVETALLILAAYLLGCATGYGLRRLLHAGRGTRQVTPSVVVAVATAPEPIRPRSTAARLAASVEVPLAARPTVRPPLAPVARPAAAIAASKPDPGPPTLSQPRDGGPDNLKQIKGIGPKIEASLHAMGIFHLDQIAGWRKADIDWVDAHLAFKGRIRRERWVEQALALSKARIEA